MTLSWVIYIYLHNVLPSESTATKVVKHILYNRVQKYFWKFHRIDLISFRFTKKCSFTIEWDKNSLFLHILFWRDSLDHLLIQSLHELICPQTLVLLTTPNSWFNQMSMENKWIFVVVLEWHGYIDLWLSLIVYTCKRGVGGWNPVFSLRY